MKKIIPPLVLIIAVTCVLFACDGNDKSSQKNTFDEASYSQVQIKVKPKIMQNFRKKYDNGEDYTQYLYELPKKDSLAMAQILQNDPDGLIAYAAANLFIRNNKKEEAVSIIASLIASGRDKTDLKGRMGYDWVHEYGQEFTDKFYHQSLTYLLKNLGQYKNDEKERVQTAIQLEIKYGSIKFDQDLLDSTNFNFE